MSISSVLSVQHYLYNIWLSIYKKWWSDTPQLTSFRAETTFPYSSVIEILNLLIWFVFCICNEVGGTQSSWTLYEEVGGCTQASWRLSDLRQPLTCLLKEVGSCMIWILCKIWRLCLEVRRLYDDLEVIFGSYMKVMCDIGGYMNLR